MDEKTRRPGKDNERQVRRAHGHCGVNRLPEDGGLAGRVAQRVSRSAGYRGTGDGPVGAGGAVEVVETD